MLACRKPISATLQLAGCLLEMLWYNLAHAVRHLPRMWVQMRPESCSMMLMGLRQVYFLA
jgi:hypothetical protein